MSVTAIGFLTVVNKGNMTLSETCRQATVLLCKRIGLQTENVWWNDVAHFRKLGHAFEYFVLGMSTRLLVNKTLIAVVICMFVSFLDQILKIFIPLRHFDITDMVFDAFGYFVGIYLMAKITNICGKKRDE